MNEIKLKQQFRLTNLSNVGSTDPKAVVLLPSLHKGHIPVQKCE